MAASENAEVNFDGVSHGALRPAWNQIVLMEDEYNIKNENLEPGNIVSDRFLPGSVDERDQGKREIVYQGKRNAGNWIYRDCIQKFLHLQTAKTWLQSNPVTVVYKLAVPVEERITAEEAYNLRTYAPYSTIWTPDDLDPEFLVDTAKNLAGAYALEGYANREKGKEMFGNRKNRRSNEKCIDGIWINGGENYGIRREKYWIAYRSHISF